MFSMRMMSAKRKRESRGDHRKLRRWTRTSRRRGRAQGPTKAYKLESGVGKLRMTSEYLRGWTRRGSAARHTRGEKEEGQEGGEPLSLASGRHT